MQCCSKSYLPATVSLHTTKHNGFDSVITLSAALTDIDYILLDSLEEYKQRPPNIVGKQ